MQDTTLKTIVKEFNKYNAPNSPIEITPTILELVKYAYRVGYGEGYESAASYEDEE